MCAYAMASNCQWTQIPRLRGVYPDERRGFARDDILQNKNKKLPILFENIQKIFTQGREVYPVVIA